MDNDISCHSCDKKESTRRFYETKNPARKPLQFKVNTSTNVAYYEKVYSDKEEDYPPSGIRSPIEPEARPKLLYDLDDDENDDSNYNPNKPTSVEIGVNDNIFPKKSHNTINLNQQQSSSREQYGRELQHKKSITQVKGKSRKKYQQTKTSENKKHEREDSDEEVDYYYQNYAGLTLSELEDSDSSDYQEEKKGAEDTDYDMTSAPIYKKPQVSREDCEEKLGQGRHVFKKGGKKRSEQPCQQSQQQQQQMHPKAPPARASQSLTDTKLGNPSKTLDFGAIGSPKKLSPLSSSYQQRPLVIDRTHNDWSSDTNSSMSDSMGESSNTTISESELVPENLWGKGVHVTSGKKEDTLEPLSKFFPSIIGDLYPELPYVNVVSNIPQKPQVVKRDFDFPPVPFKPLESNTKKNRTAHKTEEKGIEAYLIDGSTEIASMEELNMRILEFSKYLKKITSSHVCKLETISDSNTHPELQPLFENRLFKVSWIVAQTKFNKREKETFNTWRLNKLVPSLRPQKSSMYLEATSKETGAAASSSSSAEPETLTGAGALVGGSLSKALQRQSLGLLYPLERVTQTDIKQWNRRYYGEYGDLLNGMIKVLAYYKDIIDEDEDEEETETEDGNGGVEKLEDQDPYKYYSTNTARYRVGRQTLELVRGYYKTQMRVMCAQQKMEICKRHNDAVKENADISKRIFGQI